MSDGKEPDRIDSKKRQRSVKWDTEDGGDGVSGEERKVTDGEVLGGGAGGIRSSPSPAHITTIPDGIRNGGGDHRMTGRGPEAGDGLPPKRAHVPTYAPPIPQRIVTRQYAGWNIRPNYRMIEMLGHGSYGEVMAAVDVTSQRKVAIKRIVEVFRYEMDTRRFLRELHILRRVKHPNIIHLLDLFVHGTEHDFDELYLVFEYMDTDLQKLLNSSQYLEDVHIQTFLHQILSGIRYLHSAHVMHRDIKPGNVLVNEDCSIRICDFGLSRGVSVDMCTYHKHDDGHGGTGHDTASVTDTPVPQGVNGATATVTVAEGGEGVASQGTAITTATPTPDIGTVSGDVPNVTTTATSTSVSTSTVVTATSTTTTTTSTTTNVTSGTTLPTGTVASSNLMAACMVNNEVDAGPPQKKALRQMTRHVVTRWYRPPEIILTQSYTMAVDVWSAGCIFAELLGMQKSATPTEFNYRKPLFPGATCFPLSADSVMTFSSMQDQLNVIFDVIGTPSQADIQVLENDAAKKYLSKLPTKPSRPWTSLYPSASVQALDLLSRMIVFNPEHRISVADALNHPYLASVSKDFVSDKTVAPVSETINVDFAEGVSDAAELRKLMLSEISAFHIERQSLFLGGSK